MRRFALVLVVIGSASWLACSPRYQDLPLAPPLAYTLGEDQLRGGNFADAEMTFRSYLDSGEKPYRARAFYQLARAQYQQEDYVGALESLDQLDAEFPEMSAKQSAALRGDIAYAQGQRLDAILLWEKAYGAGNATEREVLTPRIRAAVDGLSESEVIELANLTETPAIYNMAIDRLPSAALPGERGRLAAAGARRADMQGKTGAADARVRSLPPAVGEDADLAPEGELAAGAATVADDTNAGAPPNTTGAAAAEEGQATETAVVSPYPKAGIYTEVEPGVEPTTGPRVACLLPLTGADGGAGRIALDQLRRAFVGASAPLIVRDSGSDPNLAARLTGQLAKDPEVLAVIGPLSPRAIARAGAVAKATGLPMLPLSTAAGLNDLARQAQQAADAVLESIDVAGDRTRDRVRESLQMKNTAVVPATGAATTAP